MSDLLDYYAGKLNADDLDSRVVNQLIESGAPVRYGLDSMLPSSYATKRMLEKGAVIDVQRPDGRYARVDDPRYGPGGFQTISAADALARWGGGRRPVDDPYGVIPTLERSAERAATTGSLEMVDYLSQFMSPDRARLEARRLTGRDPGSVLAPNARKAAGDMANIAKDEAQTAEIRDRAARERAAAESKARETAQEPIREYRQMDNTMNSLNRMEDTAREILADKAGALSRTVGPIAGRLPTGSQGAANIEAKLKNLKSQVSISVIQAIREGNKTGAAFGNVSNFEVEMLQNSLGALDLTQSPEQFRQELEKIIQYTRSVRESIGGGYAALYGDKTRETQSMPSAARTKLDARGEGNPVQFGNGQVWVLRGGVPVRMR